MPKSKAENDYNGNDLSRIFLSWVDISTLPHGDGNNVYRIKSNNSENHSDDIKETISDTQLLEEITGYRPDMPILKGIEKFVEWYKNYFYRYIL